MNPCLQYDIKTTDGQSDGHWSCLQSNGIRDIEAHILFFGIVEKLKKLLLHNENLPWQQMPWRRVQGM